MPRPITSNTWPRTLVVTAAWAARGGACRRKPQPAQPPSTGGLLFDQPIQLPATLGLAEVLAEPWQHRTQLVFQAPRRVGDGQARAIQADIGVVGGMHQQFNPQQLGRAGA